MKPLISGHPKQRAPPNDGQKFEDRKKLVEIPYKKTLSKADRNSGHLSLMDRKFKFCLDYPCENYLPLVDRSEKNKTQVGNN